MDPEAASMLIRYGVALTMVLFGINQIINPNRWIDYIPAIIRKFSPMQPQTTMRLHALGNLFFGLWLASGLYELAAVWVNIIWWITILPFALLKDWAIALRDLSIIIALIAVLFLL